MPQIVCVVIALLCSLIVCSPGRAEKNLARPAGTTHYAAMLGQLQSLLAYDKTHAGRMALTSVGQSVQKRSLWMVTLHDPTASDSGKRVFYLCRQHGHEPASTEGALKFINTLVKADKNTPLGGYLKNATVYVVPMANPDGSEAYLRHNAHDVDINRDWLKRTQPETRALYAALLKLHPDLMTDQHELYPDDTRPDFTETASVGSRAGQSVIAACEDAQNVVQGAMLAEGVPIVTHWVTDTRPARLAHRYASVVAGIPTLLFETNRLNNTGRTVAVRAAAHELFMLTVLRDMAGDHDALIAEASAWAAAHPRETVVLASRHMLPPRLMARPVPPTVEVPSE